jgi:hypothetical protein
MNGLEKPEEKPQLTYLKSGITREDEIKIGLEMVPMF